MPTFILAATLLATLAFSAVSVSAFDSAASDNLAVYWGQGNGQKPLAAFCNDDTIDIIPIGFVDVFPDEAGSNGFPGTNFANACGGAYYTTLGGLTTQLLASCPGIEADIKTCQSNGKKILLSLGGGAATAAYIASDVSATAFADFLWGAFGPVTDAWTLAGGPRPFGDAVVDGFDFDIESLAADIPTAVDFGYATMANHFRSLFDSCITKHFYLSAAPQCIVPDGHLADAISKAVFDFIFVQFYNTPQCSARAHFDSTYGQAANGGVPTDISYDSWISWVLGNSANKATKVFIGLPASTLAANAAADYLTPTEAQALIAEFQCKYPANFGGIMLWEATYSDNNQINGLSYAQVIKPFLTGNSCGLPTTSSSTTSSTTSTTTSSTTTSTTSSTSSTWTTSSTTTSSSTTSSPTSSTSSSTSSTWTTSYSSTSSPTSSSSTPVGGVSTSSPTSSASPTSSVSTSDCGWGSSCSTSSSSTPVDGVTTSSSTSSTSSITSSSTFSTPTGWSTFGTCTSSTCKSLATGPGTPAGPAATTSSGTSSATPVANWASWSADPSTSSTLTSTWTIVRPTSTSTSSSTTSASTTVVPVITMTIVPVPSSVWYASTYSRPSSVPTPSLSLAPTASALPSAPSSSSSTLKSATGASVSSWPTASLASAATPSTVAPKSSSTTTPVLPALTMTTVSVAQGATWSSDPSLTLSTNTNSVQATQAAPFAPFTGAASRPQMSGGKGLWVGVVMGVLGLVGVLV